MADIIDLYDAEGGPGRSRILRRPSRRTLDRIERHRAAVEAHEAQDVVVKTARDAAKLEALYVAREEIAVEAAALLWERLNARPGSRELGRISSRRVAALAEIASLTVAITRADPDAPPVAIIKRVLALLWADIQGAAGEIFDAPTAARLAAAVERRLGDGALDEMIGLR